MRDCIKKSAQVSNSAISIYLTDLKKKKKKKKTDQIPGILKKTNIEADISIAIRFFVPIFARRLPQQTAQHSDKNLGYLPELANVK